MWITQSRQHIYIKFPFIISYGYHYLRRRYPVWISFIGAQFDKNVWWRIWKTLYVPLYTSSLLHLYTIQRMLIPHQSQPSDQLAGPTCTRIFFFLKRKLKRKERVITQLISLCCKRASTVLFFIFYFFFFRQPKEQ
jgi:hypothetical protein